MILNLGNLKAVLFAAAVMASGQTLAQQQPAPSGAAQAPANAASQASGPRFPKALKITQTKPASNHWLLDADSDQERFRRIELVTSGYDIAMIEIAHRFEELYSALRQTNWRMASYQLDKMRARLNQTGLKRPARTENMERMFLETKPLWAVGEAIRTQDKDRALLEMGAVRDACMACHVVEKLDYINGAMVFERTK